MTDIVNGKTRSRIMARVASKNTRPELRVRRDIHSAGFRYRLHVSMLPGSPDLVFPRFKLALFIHGCFWHKHMCSHFRMPASNQDYWSKKLARNVERDRSALGQLESLGWRCRVIWECELDEGIADTLAELRDLAKATA